MLSTPEARIDRLGLWAICLMVVAWLLFTGPCALDPQSILRIDRLETQNELQWKWIQAYCTQLERGDCQW